MNNYFLMRNLGIIATIIQTFGVLMGLSIFLAGLFRLKRYGEMRTFMSQQQTIGRPLMMLFAGIALLCLPMVIQLGLDSFWGTSSPLAYPNTGGGYESLLPPIILFVRLIGVGAFIRGWVLLSRVGGEQSQPGLLGKACIHILGGILCIHIIGTYDLLASIFNFM